MNRRDIEGYDIMNRPLPSDAAYASTDKLFHGIAEKKKKTFIKNQQMYDYHMYRNRLPWELHNKKFGYKLTCTTDKSVVTRAPLACYPCPADTDDRCIPV